MIEFFHIFISPDLLTKLMNMKYINTISVLFITLLFSLSACDKEGDENNFSGEGPEISWITGGTSMTFSYSSGALSAYNLKRSFTVTGESGEVTINVQIEGRDDPKVSGTFNVEKGKTYGLSLRGGINGRQTSSPGTSCFNVVFSSPNSRTEQKLAIDSYLVQSFNEWIQDSYYCPKSLNFGEISISD